MIHTLKIVYQYLFTILVFTNQSEGCNSHLLTNPRYPRADMPNAVSTLRLLRFTLAPGSQDEVTDIVQYDLVTSLQVENTDQ